MTAIELVEKIIKKNYSYDCGDCGDFVRTVIETVKSGVAMGVIAYDGDLVHVVIEENGDYADGKGVRDIDDIMEEWSYDRDIDEMEIVELELIDNEYVFGEKSISAEYDENILRG